MKTEEQIRQKLNELKDEWVQLSGSYKHGHVLNKNIKLLEWILEEETVIEVNEE